MAKRNVYLDMKTLEDARDVFSGSFDWTAIVGTERIETVDALGRVTASPVFSVLSSPGYHGAAMDGFAMRAVDTFGASEETPVRLKLGVQAHPVNTGQPLPDDCDAVVMIEHVHQPDESVVELTAALFPFQHVRKVGEDIVARELVLPHHHRLGAADVPALVAAGVVHVEVLELVRVAIIATGTELLDWKQLDGSPLEPGRIVETNSMFLAGLVRERGGEPEVQKRRPDDPDAIEAAVKSALDGGAHLVLVNAGASSGSHDYTSHVLGNLGEVLVHGIRAMPGKPTILARVGQRPVVGTPGYPVSAWVCFDQFVGPAIDMMQGQQPRDRETIDVVPARKLASKPGLEEFLRVHLGRVGQRVVATPLKRGAGTISSLTRADGIIRIAATSEGIDEIKTVKAELLRPRAVVDRTLVIVGSHDVTLDLMADHIREIAPEIHVSASHVGSLAGLIALRDGRSHLGGTHLLDVATGEYNVSWVRKHVTGMPVRLVTLAHREQGLIVPAGNPDEIRGLSDLTRPGMSFVNRQAGAGTRVLFDYHLERSSIDPGSVHGYEHEEFTHMAVAVQVLTGAVRAGMGIRAAANALDLDFVPVATERYDLCIPLDHLEDSRIVALLSVLDSAAFRDRVEKLGGYDVTHMGEVVWEG